MKIYSFYLCSSSSFLENEVKKGHDINYSKHCHVNLNLYDENIGFDMIKRSYGVMILA